MPRHLFVFAVAALAASVARAQSRPVVADGTGLNAPVPPPAEAPSSSCALGNDPEAFVGARLGVVAAPGAKQITPTGGVEVGFASKGGMGLGVHFLTALDTPDLAGYPSTPAAFGVALDARYYVQAVDRVAIYGTLAGGFMVGKNHDGTNLMLPVLNPGFGVRFHASGAYAAFEFGFADFYMPFGDVSVGYQWS